MLPRFLLTALIALALLPATALAVEPGVVTGPGQTADEVTTATSLGAKWVRVFVSWPAVEPREGGWNDGDVSTRLQALTRSGVKTLVVLVGSPAYGNGGSSNASTPPIASKFADFAEAFAQRNGQYVDAYEIWNEPDGKNFWAPNGADPSVFADLLNATYPRLKAADNTATIVTGGLVGNDYDFVDVLEKKAHSSFDAIGVHTDTACLVKGPDFQYRDEKGRIGRYVFTGYREVHQTMLDNGDTARKIWMTELGWSTPGGRDIGTTKCIFGGQPLPGKENEPGGVGYADQAKFLTQAYQCLQTDQYVDHAMWFAAQDTSNSTNSEERYGLLEADNDHKDAFAAFKNWAATPSTTSGCGSGVDRTPPVVKITSPADGFQYAGPLTVTANATDELEVTKMELYVDGQKIGGQQSGAKFSLNWDGAKKLSNAKHTFTLKAYDPALNVGTASVSVTKVDPAQLTVPAAKLAFAVGKVKSGRNLTISGRVTAPGATFKPKGKIRVFVELKKHGRYKQISRYTKGAAHGFKLKIKLKSAGSWRIWARYSAQPPFKSLRSKYFVLKAH